MKPLPGITITKENLSGGSRWVQISKGRQHKSYVRLWLEMLLWHRHSTLLTGAGIVPLLNKSFNGDRRWSSSHSTHPRWLTSGATASFKCQPQQKGVQPAPIAQATEVKQACVRPAFLSYSIYMISIPAHRVHREGRRCVYAMSTVESLG